MMLVGFAGTDAVRFVKQYHGSGLGQRLPLTGHSALTVETILPALGDAALGIVTVGAYTLALVQSLHGSWWLALALAPFVGAVIGLIVERTMIRHLYTRPLATILATWGLSLVLQQLLQVLFGAAPQRAEPSAIRPFNWPSRQAAAGSARGCGWPFPARRHYAA